MMGTKKLSEIKAEVAEMVSRLPKGWLAKEIESAKRDPRRSPKTLEMLRAALEDEGNKRRKSKKRQSAKR